MQGSLFSSYFLEEGIRETEDWKRLSFEEVQDLFSKISEVFQKMELISDRADEADTEDTAIRPILELLGFSYFRQKSISNRRGDVPDFVLFGEERDKEKFAKNKNWNRALAILEAKRWNRNVEKDVGQILRYLSAAEVESNGKIVWGILTNGRVWRLYYHKFPSRAEGYVEFDLAKAIKEKDINLIKLFYLLFRKEAFTPTEWRKKSFLEIALEEGKKWEERVSENLENKIFFEIFPSISKGFIEVATKRGRKRDEKLLKEVYENTLIFLYRILFLLYAEDRGLLPIDDENYKPYSFTKIREEIAELVDSGKTLSCKFFFYDRLKNLFRIVDKGDKALKIPPYNGGLFKPESHPFLERYAVPDRYLVPALDKLSREEGRFINYRDLSVRQLGSIYEGLLEFKLKLAEKPLKVGRKNGVEVYRTAKLEKEAVVKAGNVYLTNEKDERKSSGSYYTPDYIVQTILRETTEPFVEKKLKEFHEKVSELKKLKGYSAKWKTEELKKFDPAEALLELKILDPAMGSGHFLVGAVDYLSDRVLELVYEVSGKTFFGSEIYESPLVQKLKEIRKKIVERAEKEGYRIREEKLSDKNLVKRIVLKRCIYGVDLNPLAVELAKVSLWLHTFTVGAPLSFLDHHLKCGNSLIGADPESFEELFSNSLFGSRYKGLLNALKLLEKVQELTDSDISEVEESARIYSQVTQELEPYRKVLDIFVARHFLNNGLQLLIDGTKGNPLDVVEGKVNLEKDKHLKALLEKALKLAEEKRFFHWELEFPEVWQREKKGFDIVLGNPPYVRIQEMKKNKKEEINYFNRVFKTPEGSYDLYILFIEKGLSLLNEEGILGYIVPNKFTKLNYGKKLRKLIAKHLNTFVDFGDNQIFPNQTTYTGLLFLTKKERDKAKISRAPHLKGESEIKGWLSEFRKELFEVSTSSLTEAPWILVSKSEGEILKKME
jgi:type I restriction-modification system DNA methylase subunit